MMRRSIIAFLLVIPAIGFVAGNGTAQTLPNRAIVDGHHIQPRADQFDGAKTPDLMHKDRDEIERLYEELTRDAAPATSGDLATPRRP